MHNNTCPDCGPAPVNHRLRYFTVLADYLTSPFNKFIELLRFHLIAPLLLPLRFDRLALPVFRTLQNLHLGKLIDEPDSQNNSRAFVLWESARKLGIQMYEFRLLGRALETYVAIFGQESKFFYEMPRPNKALTSGFWWMDNKPVMRKKIAAKGIPVAIGGSAFRLPKALAIFRQINGQAIVKPSQGSRSRHTTVGISTEQDLTVAFIKAKQLSPFALIEQQLAGQVYRATVIGGEVAAVILRSQPFVVADGTRTIRELIAAENHNPKRRDGSFHEIPLDAEVESYLQKQKLSLQSVPRSGQKIYVHDKVSRGVGAATEDVTGLVHPDNIEMFKKIAQVVDDSLIGIDFIIEDISKSWSSQKLCGVIECNSVPFIDLHHNPYLGQPRDVSAKLWQQIFPQLQQVRASQKQTV